MNKCLKLFWFDVFYVLFADEWLKTYEGCSEKVSEEIFCFTFNKLIKLKFNDLQDAKYSW